MSTTPPLRAEVPQDGPLQAPLAFRVDWGAASPVTLLRYPGGKQRLYWAFAALLPRAESLRGRLVEPFVGSGAVFFLYNPGAALLADINPELIDLYRAVRDAPQEVWARYAAFPPGREGYYAVRRLRLPREDLVGRAARTLYLSRTCFKGQWRMNAQGEFNVGYGGPDRRNVVTLIPGEVEA